MSWPWDARRNSASDSNRLYAPPASTNPDMAERGRVVISEAQAPCLWANDIVGAPLARTISTPDFILPWASFGLRRRAFL